MYLRHQAYTLYYRHVFILVFLHIFAFSMLLYCDACLNSSALRVGLKTLLNTILCCIFVVLSNYHDNLLVCKKVPCLKNLQLVYFVTYRNILGYCCQRRVFCAYCRKKNSFCVERVKRFVNVQLHCFVSNLKSITMEKFLQTFMERGLRPF